MNQKLFVYKDGQQYGPFTPQEAWEMVLKGQFNPETDSAWQEGISDWLPLKDVILQVAPPAQPAKDEQPTLPQERAAIPSEVEAVSVKPKVIIGVLAGIVILIAVGLGTYRSFAATNGATPKADDVHSMQEPGTFAGIGMQPAVDGVSENLPDSTIIKNNFSVDDVMSGSPAENAGLIKGDKIIQVDDVSLDGKTLVQAMGMIRGKVGTSVKVTVLRNGSTTPLYFTMVRVPITITPASSPSTVAATPDTSSQPAAPPSATQDAVKAPSVTDYYGEYSGKTDAYHVKDKDGNDVLNNGSPIIVHGFDTSVKFTSTGIEVSQINTNTDVISMLSQGDVQVNAVDVNSVTITVTVAQSLNARLSASKPSYKFVFNKDGTGKMIPLTEQNAPTIDLTNTSISDKPKTATIDSTSSDVPKPETITDAPMGDRYYFEGDQGDKRMILMLTRTSKDIYLTFIRAYDSDRPYMVYHLTYDGAKEDANQVDYGTLQSDFVYGVGPVPSAHNEQIVYTKSSDTFTVTFTTGSSTFTKQEPTDLQGCITTAKGFLAKVLQKKEHDDLVQNGAYFVTKQIESKVGPVNQIALYSDKADEITNAEITYTVLMGDNTSHYVTVRGSKDNWKITDVDYKTP